MTTQATRISLALITLGTLSIAAFSAASEPTDATMGAKPPEGAVVLFGGKSFSGWLRKDGKGSADWPVKDGVVTVGHGDAMTTERFGDFQLHLEFNIPYMPKAHGQGRGNSGVYLAGAYELQVLDSYGLKLQNNDCGAIYLQVVPSENACKPPLRWQTYDVTFHKAKVRGGKVVKKARVTVVQNGIEIIKDREISPSPGGANVKEGEQGPLLLQDHGNAVEYRNIWIKPLD